MSVNPTDPTTHAGRPARLASLGINPGFVYGMTAYAVLVAAAVMILKATDPPRPIAVLLTLPPVAAAVYAVTSHFRFVRRTEGVERTATTEAAAFAFYVVVLSALSYFFLESWAELPRLSMLWVWVYGMAVFGVNSIVISRRMS